MTEIVCLYVDGGIYFKFYEPTIRHLLYPKKVIFTTDKSKKPKILLYSIFGNDAIKYKNCIKILFNGEPYFDESKYKDANLIITCCKDIKNKLQTKYIPFYVSSFGERTIHNTFDLVKRMYHFPKTHFCAFLYSHASTPRDRLFDIINKYKRVDALGKHKNKIRNFRADRYGKNGLTYNDLAVLKYKPYKFAICGENTNKVGKHPLGYVSEKIISMMLAYCIPIYVGSADIEEHFNPEAIINVNTLREKDIINRIKQFDQNEELYMKKLRQPWFKNNVLNEYFSTYYINKLFEPTLKKVR